MKKRIQAISICFLVLTPFGGAVAENTDLMVTMQRTDCTKVAETRVFDLRVFGRRFPMSDNFDFNGLERGSAVFMRRQKENPTDELDKYPDEKALLTAIDQWSRSIGIVRISAERIEISAAVGESDFRVFDWKGLSIYFRTTHSDGIWRAPTYQAVVHKEGFEGEISISAGSMRIIADIIACVN